MKAASLRERPWRGDGRSQSLSGAAESSAALGLSTHGEDPPEPSRLQAEQSQPKEHLSPQMGDDPGLSSAPWPFPGLSPVCPGLSCAGEPRLDPAPACVPPAEQRGRIPSLQLLRGGWCPSLPCGHFAGSRPTWPSREPELGDVGVNLWGAFPLAPAPAGDRQQQEGYGRGQSTPECKGRGVQAGTLPSGRGRAAGSPPTLGGVWCVLRASWDCLETGIWHFFFISHFG